MKEVIGIILAIVLVACIAYGSWTIQKKVNYKFMYSSQVEKQIQPLVVRINELEKRVKALESK
jgi:hypothetical protein